MILITDLFERFAVFVIVSIVYPAIRVAEFFLQRNLLDD